VQGLGGFLLVYFLVAAVRIRCSRLSRFIRFEGEGQA
jgi:hypothetical protein